MSPIDILLVYCFTYSKELFSFTNVSFPIVIEAGRPQMMLNTNKSQIKLHLN
jgi:hypothetical protein